MNWGKSEGFLESLCEKGKDPQALRDKPNIPLHLQEYLYAFNMLNSARSSGYALQHISLPDLICYTKEFGTPSGVRVFTEIIQLTDIAFLECMNKNDGHDLQSFSSG